MSNPIVDQFVPGVLYVKMVALLDEALAQYMSDNNLRIARGYRNDLNGRICTLDGLGCLVNAGELHRIRGQRNQLAHQSNVSTDWNRLRDDTTIVHAELKHLGLVGDQPTVEPFGERGSPNFDHALPGVSHLQDYRVGAKVNGQVAAEMTWSLKTRMGWDEEKVRALDVLVVTLKSVQAALAAVEAHPAGRQLRATSKKVFFSWQKTLPNATNRGLIESALTKAIEKLGDVEVDETVDRDTLDVAGAPDIVSTILDKIDNAGVFVADVSIVTPQGFEKPSPNPNVLLELGYALRARSGPHHSRRERALRCR